MSYGKVHDAYWEGEKIEPLSDRAALLGLYLITGKHRNAIGCFKLGVGAITDVPRFGEWGIEGVSEALREMMKTGFIVRDERTGWTLIANHLNKDPIKGAKAAIHAAKLAMEVPCNSPVYPRLKAVLEPQLEEEKKALAKAQGWPMRSPSEGVSKPHTIPKPSPDPIPEPEPEPSPSLTGAPAARVPAPVERVVDGDLLDDMPAFLDRTPDGDVVKLWNAMAEKAGLQAVQKITEARRRLIRARLKDVGGMAGMTIAIERVGNSARLRGERNGKGHEGWKADFDFVFKEANFVKLMEGIYDDAANGSGRLSVDEQRRRDLADIAEGAGLRAATG